MLRDELRYAYSVARVRSLETRLLDRAKVERLLDASDAEDLLRALQETEYAPHVAVVKSPHEYEEILARELRRVRELVTSFAPDPDLAAVFFARYDFHNLRAVIKAVLQGSEPAASALSRAGQLPVETLRDLVALERARLESGSPDSGPGSTDGGTRESLTEVALAVQRAANLALRAFRDDGDPQAIDLVIDRAAQEYYLAVAARHQAEFLRDYLSRQADLTNLKSYLRVRRMGRDAFFLRSVLLAGGTVADEAFTSALEGPVEAILAAFSGTIYESVAQEGVHQAESTGRLTRLEALTWDFLMSYLKRARHIHFDYPAVLAYVMAKEAETRLLRLLFVGKLNGLSREKIAERLSDTYV